MKKKSLPLVFTEEKNWLMTPYKPVKYPIYKSYLVSPKCGR